MLKFAFEKEYFVVNSKKELVVLPTTVPHDDCGFLAESRGDKHSDVLSAAYLMLSAEEKLLDQLRKLKYRVKKSDFEVLPKALEKEALRTYGKHPQTPEQGNIYGFDYPVDEEPIARAGLHVHFSNDKTYIGSDNRAGNYYGMLNIPKLIQLLDKAFKSEIEEAKRLPGFYEMKPYGFEYRSLPASIDPRDVAEVLANRTGIKEW